MIIGSESIPEMRSEMTNDIRDYRDCRIICRYQSQISKYKQKKEGEKMGFSISTCTEFVEVLASKAPVPGGGGASGGI